MSLLHVVPSMLVYPIISAARCISSESIIWIKGTHTTQADVPVHGRRGMLMSRNLMKQTPCVEMTQCTQLFSTACIDDTVPIPLPNAASFVSIESN